MMTTTANELGEREEKGKQDKETERKTVWKWICTNNGEENEIRFEFFIFNCMKVCNMEGALKTSAVIRPYK
jgi:hypothetical protein